MPFLKQISQLIKQCRHRCLLIVLLSATLSLAGCASSNLKAPCPDFGKHCQKVPVNHWNNT